MDINTDAIEIATETVDELYTPELNPLAQALYSEQGNKTGRNLD